MKCPKCGSTNCQMTVTNNTKVHTKNKGYGFFRGCCCYTLMGPIGLLCGFCGSGKSHSWTESTQKEFWVCQECGSRFTASDAANSTVVPAKFYCDNANNYIEYQENILVKNFVKGYAENWSSSLLGNDLVIRKTENVKFENHKNSCEAGWFENIPIIFALEEQTGVILTPQSLIIDTVCLPLASIKHIAIQENTIYAESFCIRFASLQKAELFYQMLQELFGHIKIDYNRFSEYADLLMFLQSLPKSQQLNQAAHFSSQEEYARFVGDLTKKGMEVFSQQYPRNYECYIQAQSDKEKLSNPAILALFIQLALIFLLHMVYKSFLNAVLFTVLWGIPLVLVVGIYLSVLESGFKKKIKEYIPKELNSLIDENESTNIAKTGAICAADTEMYIRLDGVSELKDNPEQASIKKKSMILYIILVAMFIIISCFEILQLTKPKHSEDSVVPVQALETNAEYVESAETVTVDDSLAAYLSEGIPVKGEDLLANPNQYLYQKIIIQTTVVTVGMAGLAEYTDDLKNFSEDEIAYLNNLPLWFGYDEFLGTYLMVYDDRYDTAQEVGGMDSFTVRGIFMGLSKDNSPVILARYIDEKFDTIDEEFVMEDSSIGAEYIWEEDNSSYIIEGSDTRYLAIEELVYMSKEELRLAHNEIYARHGRKFKAEDLNEYFSSQPWYHGYLSLEEFDESVLNEYEKANLDLMTSIKQSVEQENISSEIYSESTEYQANNENYMVLPESNSRYYDSYELSELSKEELRLARNEIYARHGRRFETEDLNQYFSSQPWYHGYLSADEFDESVFNGYEKANLDLIKNVENQNTNELNNIKVEDVFSKFDVNGVPTWGRTDNDIYMIPELGAFGGNDKTILFSCEPNSYEYAMIYYCDVEETSTTKDRGLACIGSLYDYHTGEIMGRIQVIWNSYETIDYPIVNVLEGNADVSGEYQYSGLSE